MRSSWRFVSALHAMTQGTARFTREAGGFSSRTYIFQWLLVVLLGARARGTQAVPARRMRQGGFVIVLGHRADVRWRCSLVASASEKRFRCLRSRPHRSCAATSNYNEDRLQRRTLREYYIAQPADRHNTLGRPRLNDGRCCQHRGAPPYRLAWAWGAACRGSSPT